MARGGWGDYSRGAINWGTAIIQGNMVVHYLALESTLKLHFNLYNVSGYPYLKVHIVCKENCFRTLT